MCFTKIQPKNWPTVTVQCSLFQPPIANIDNYVKLKKTVIFNKCIILIKVLIHMNIE
jgi:hypothetical protein